MKKVIPIGAYFARAKVFAYIMAITAGACFLLWLFNKLNQ